MPRRRHFFALISLLTIFVSSLVAGCAVFRRPSEFQKGLRCYERDDYEKAIAHFVRYQAARPSHDTTLYYLYACYRKTNDGENSFRILELLAGLGVDDENVYFNLYHHYRSTGNWQALYELLASVTPGIGAALDRRTLLTRRLLAEILCGAAGRAAGGDPVGFALERGLLKKFSDGNSYENDTITVGNLIVILDQRLEPFYPSTFHDLKHLSSRSFLYLPYMRLVESGLLPLNPEIDPAAPAVVMQGTAAAKALVRRGLLGAAR